MPYISFPHLLPPWEPHSGSQVEASGQPEIYFRCPQLPTAVPADMFAIWCWKPNFMRKFFLREASWRFLCHWTWIWVPKSFRAWIQAATAIQGSLFFSLKRAEIIANLAPWPGSNLTSVHQLDWMGPAFSFQKCVHSSNRTLNKLGLILHQVGDIIYIICMSNPWTSPWSTQSCVFKTPRKNR